MSSNTILPRSFYERDTLCVVKDLLGKVLKFADYYGVINEVEAYIGQDDPACHAARGCTPRTAVMFGSAGFSYVYLIYGMYHCLNIVTEREGFPAAVLIRGIDLYKPTVLSLNGPGKLCKKLNITKNNNQIDLTKCDNFCVYDSTARPEYIATPRWSPPATTCHRLPVSINPSTPTPPVSHSKAIKSKSATIGLLISTSFAISKKEV